MVLQPRCDKSTCRASRKVAYRPRGGFQRTSPGTLVHWLTARYCLYAATRSGRLLRGEINHDPWVLADATVELRENTMTDWLNVRLPDRPPLCHVARDIRVTAWTNVAVEGVN